MTKPNLELAKKLIVDLIYDIDKYRISICERSVAVKPAYLDVVERLKIRLGLVDGFKFPEDALRLLDSCTGQPDQVHLQGKITKVECVAKQCSRCGLHFCDANRLPIVLLKCGHGLHRECLAQLLANGNFQCPQCKSPLFGKN
jgi:hypothetical protein